MSSQQADESTPLLNASGGEPQQDAAQDGNDASREETKLLLIPRNRLYAVILWSFMLLLSVFISIVYLVLRIFLLQNPEYWDAMGWSYRLSSGIEFLPQLAAISAVFCVVNIVWIVVKKTHFPEILNLIAFYLLAPVTLAWGARTMSAVFEVYSHTILSGHEPLIIPFALWAGTFASCILGLSYVALGIFAIGVIWPPMWAWIKTRFSSTPPWLRKREIHIYVHRDGGAVEELSGLAA